MKDHVVLSNIPPKLPLVNTWQVKRKTKNDLCVYGHWHGGWCQREGLRNNNNRKAGSFCFIGKTRGLSESWQSAQSMDVVFYFMKSASRPVGSCFYLWSVMRFLYHAILLAGIKKCEDYCLQIWRWRQYVGYIGTLGDSNHTTWRWISRDSRHRGSHRSRPALQTADVVCGFCCFGF